MAYRASRKPNHFLHVGLPMFTLIFGGWYIGAQFLQARIDVRDAEKQYMDERMPADKIIIRKKDEEAERAWLEKLKRDDWDLKPVPREGNYWEEPTVPEADPEAARAKLKQVLGSKLSKPDA